MAKVVIHDDHGNSEVVRVYNIDADNTIDEYLWKCPVCNKALLRGKEACKRDFTATTGVFGIEGVAGKRVFVRLKRELGEIRLSLCDRSGRDLNAPYIAALTPAGKLKLFRNVNREVGLITDSDGRIETTNE